MNQQKSLAEQFAENRRWLEAEWKKLGLEETLAAGNASKPEKESMATNRLFAPKQRQQPRS